MTTTTILSDNGVSSGTAGIKTTGGNDGTLQLQTTTAGGAATTALTIDTSQSTTINSSASTAPLIVKINNTESGRFDSSGNLVVGATSGQGKIASAIGSANANCFDATFSGGGGAGVGYQSRYQNTTGTAYHAYFTYNATGVGSIQSSSTTTSYITSSDYRLKENVQPMVGALQTVTRLKPVTYSWKSDGSDGQGFIAHELQEVVPDCVSGEKDAVDADGNPVYQGIDTSFLVATLTAAIQEQQALITTLTERISALEAK